MHFCQDEATALLAAIPAIGMAWRWLKNKAASFWSWSLSKLGKKPELPPKHEHSLGTYRDPEPPPVPPSDTYVDGIGDDWAREPGDAWINEGRTSEGRTQWRRLAPGEYRPAGKVSR